MFCNFAIKNYHLQDTLQQLNSAAYRQSRNCCFSHHINQIVETKA